MKKQQIDVNATTDDAPEGVWVRKGEWNHLYGSVSFATNLKCHVTFLKLSCDCGVEAVDLGMNLATLKIVSAGLARAVEEIERAAAAPGSANVH
ncbi:hypothetical protein ACQE3D_18265 [Methylomonas sp. MS20]|uniref:hypothetical protein n=1 Tax=Methylomonas sp. MS20 TaxID=3418769 RepID=UPI003D07A0DF